ncbi:TRIM3 [Branchiostoma lanceolatum]|uniref:TRIM3 protein n=1 Tax=Branchiostoma lanceolatum TaxID=7740 RepID=A0A8J9W117_BRALA|nr:TRIM3 [Branchiostoma lanceolatum]
MTSSPDDLLTEFRFLICRLCHQPLHRPRILHCWHYFCLHCIGGHLKSNHSVQCPVCDVKTLLHNEGLGGLTHKAGGLLSRLSETWNKISVCDLDTEVRHHCHYLAKTISDPLQCLVPSTRVCHSCEEYMCEDCSPLHLIEMHSEQYYLCKRHGEPELAFCEDCRVVACFICTREEHLYHDTWGLVEKAERYKTEVKELIEKCRNRRWRVEDNLEASVRKTKSEIQNEAKKALAVLTRMIKQREGELLGQVDQFAMDMWIKIHREKQNIEPQTERYDGLVTLGESLVDFGSSQEIVTTHQHLRYRLSGAIAEQSPLQVPELLRKEISFIPADLTTVEEEELIGNLNFSPESNQEQMREDSPTSDTAESRDDDAESRDDDVTESRDDHVIPAWVSEESAAEVSAAPPSEEAPVRKRKMSIMDNILKIGRDFERRRSLDTILDEEDNSKNEDVKVTISEPTSPKKRHFSAEDTAALPLRPTEEEQAAQNDIKKAKSRRKMSLPATSFHRSMESLITGKNKDRAAASSGKLGNGKDRRFSVFGLSWNRQEASIAEDVSEAHDEEPAEEKKTLEPKLSSSSLGSLLDSGSGREDEDDDEEDAKDEKGNNKKPRFKVKNLMKKAKSTLSLLPVASSEPNGKESGAWNDTLRRKKSSGDSSLNGFSDVGDTNEYDGSRKRYSMTSSGSSATITSTGSEGEGTITGVDVSGDGASSSASENRKKRDPKKWMSKRRADIKHFSRRISVDLSNSIKAWKAQEEEEENERRVHPWDEVATKRHDFDLDKVSEINSEDSDDQYETTPNGGSQNGGSGSQNGVNGRVRNRRVTFDNVSDNLRGMNIQSESEDSEVDAKHSGVTEVSLPNGDESDGDPKLSDDDDRTDEDDVIDGNAVNGLPPYIQGSTRATKYVPRKWSRFKANFSPQKNERKTLESETAERSNYYRSRRFSMF